jgi:hypothetical protein
VALEVVHHGHSARDRAVVRALAAAFRHERQRRQCWVTCQNHYVSELTTSGSQPATHQWMAATVSKLFITFIT